MGACIKNVYFLRYLSLDYITVIYFSVDNAMQSLIGHMTGKDTDLQLAAVWCLTNMSAGTHEHAMLVVKSAAPYLTTYLDSGSHVLKVM